MHFILSSAPNFGATASRPQDAVKYRGLLSAPNFGATASV